ncbi:hypothetical protein DNTS_007155 [Danionella cerebrum]|uniref:PAS domain-containing protein n=1 Tax=Danionella cerebrum TaxID=2873325 RepID=A0A553QHQ4_9TELE|nr:hypothetical protein DNTS_007155 [Danionella translucida]
MLLWSLQTCKESQDNLNLSRARFFPHHPQLATVNPIFPVELTGSSVFDYVHPGDHVEMAEQLGMKLPPGRGLLCQGNSGGVEDGHSSASSSSHPGTPEPVSRCFRSLIQPQGSEDTAGIWPGSVTVWVIRGFYARHCPQSSGVEQLHQSCLAHIEKCP